MYLFPRSKDGRLVGKAKEPSDRPGYARPAAETTTTGST